MSAVAGCVPGHWCSSCQWRRGPARQLATSVIPAPALTQPQPARQSLAAVRRPPAPCGTGPAVLAGARGQHGAAEDQHEGSQHRRGEPLPENRDADGHGDRGIDVGDHTGTRRADLGDQPEEEQERDSGADHREAGDRGEDPSPTAARSSRSALPAVHRRRQRMPGIQRSCQRAGARSASGWRSAARWRSTRQRAAPP